MKEDKTNKQEAVFNSEMKTYQTPKGKKKTWSWKRSGKSFNCSAEADWLLIRKKEKPIADVFYTYYSLERDDKSCRPLTFVFNGGPGASSAYLHVGALGPKSISFGKKGECLPPPNQLKDNPESWLEFTDLVFLDPVGTGFSRSLEEIDFDPPERKEKDKKSSGEVLKKEFYQIDRDLETIGEFVQRFLSKYCRWSSPVFIAGESYGGFRVAKLSKKLQENYGIGLCGVILISPCFDLTALSPSDYNVLYWVNSFPSMAAAAAYHGQSQYFKNLGEKDIGGHKAEQLKVFLKPAEEFALNEMSLLLIQGEVMDDKRRDAVIQKAIDFIAVPLEKMRKGNGRLNIWQFCRLLLQKERKWCGLYDASVTAYDPFPHRDQYEGPDPTFSGVEYAFSHGVNILLREFLELDCERQYRLLNMEVFQNWKRDIRDHAFNLQLESTDDLRYAMTMNPNMKVFVCHGIFDLVTPYFSSERVIQLMNLPEPLKNQIDFKVYHGGHMFYTWENSRQLFKSQMQKFYGSDGSV